MASEMLPSWLLDRPKSWRQAVVDLVAAPLRMVVLPDRRCEAFHITSLRGERIAAALPELRGRVLDVGAGENTLVRAYRCRTGAEGAGASVGVDILPTAPDVLVVDSSSELPFDDAVFDTVVMLACLNHIPDRTGALAEARRVTRTGGTLVVSMISRTLGELGHRLWWYSEDKHREVEHGEVGGIDHRDMLRLLDAGGFTVERTTRFVYGMNRLYVARAS